MATRDHKPEPDKAAIWAAMAACLVMIAYHVGSKAVRDALFLSKFEVTALPKMVIVASLFSIVSVLGTSRAMMRLTPARLVPVSFFVSGLLQLGVYFMIDQFPRACAVIMYLQSVALGSLLTSGFWSMINERFDPRTAKQLVGRIAGSGTLGGMIGGVVAERLAAHYSLPVLIPVLALYHFTCAGLLRWGLKGNSSTPAPEPSRDNTSGWELVKGAPYLRTLAAVVILGTISAAMIDYVFKNQALNFYGKGENLLRFFAMFYSVSGVLTFLVQTGLSSFALSKFGMARTVGTLPFAVSIGGLLALLFQGLGSATIARMLEAVFRGSLFRAGYELFYTPMPTNEKRAAKAVVDVGFDRMGDAVGSGLVSLMLLLGPALALPGILTGAIVVALAGLFVASRLQGAYIDALERGLLERGGEFASEAFDSSMAITGFADVPTLFGNSGPIPTTPQVKKDDPPSQVMDTAITAVGPSTIASDAVVQQTAALRSGSATQVRKVLASGEPVKAYLVPHLIALLGWDRVSTEIQQALGEVAAKHSGQLLDALLDPQTDFSIRRRIPRILAGAPSRAVAQGLMSALNDRRFEVRFQSGRALALMAAGHADLGLAAESVFHAIRKEVAVSKPVWDSHRLLDRGEDSTQLPFMDEYLRDRTSRSLQHLFTLLSLVLPTEPLQIAFHGLHAEDSYLRGTALEYLDSILPHDIRDRLWPLLERRADEPKDQRPRDQILADLMRSSQSIIIRMEELRKRSESDSSGGA